MPKAKIQKTNNKEKEKVSFQTPRGMRDILPYEWPLWEKVYRAAKEVAESYNFVKIVTPVLEQTDLFVRGVGESTDIVEKEMYPTYQGRRPTYASAGGNRAGSACIYPTRYAQTAAASEALLS